MGFIKSQGSLEQTSSRTDPVRLRPELEDKRPVVNNEVIAADRPVRNTFLANTATNNDSFKNELSLIAGYPEGRVIHVTWYSQQQALVNIRSMNVERLTEDSDLTHKSYIQIRNFELRLSNAFEYNFESDSNKSSFSGEAIVLAGFEPLISDIFLYKLRNEKIGVFCVNSCDRLSLGNDTYHKITFNLSSYLTPIYKEQLASQTTSIMYYDKVKFLAGNHAFLTSDNYTLKKDLMQIKKEIIGDYVGRFFTTKYNSFVRPDDVYDPYVVEYWNKKVSFADANIRPIQMLVSVQAYDSSIWSILTGSPIRSIKRLERVYKIMAKRYATWDSNLNGLIGNLVLLMGKDIAFEIRADAQRRASSNVVYLTGPVIPVSRDELERRLSAEHDKWYGDDKDDTVHTPEHDDHPSEYCRECLLKVRQEAVINKDLDNVDVNCDYYALSKYFYEGSPAMSSLEKMIYDNILNREISPTEVFRIIDEYIEWDDASAFYQHLLALHLIDYSLYWLMHHS